MKAYVSPGVAYISRNPFARYSFVRIKHPKPGECKWCGGKARFSYGCDYDQRPGEICWMGPFCSIGCFRDYHQIKRGEI